MDTNINTYSVTDLRHKTNRVLKDVTDRGIVYLVRHSKTEAALVDLDYFNALRGVYEDYLDTVEFDKTIKQKRVSLDKHKKTSRKTV